MTLPAWRVALRSSLWKRLACWSGKKLRRKSKGLDQPARATLRKYGVRFGAYHIYLAGAAEARAACARQRNLWAIKHESPDAKGVGELLHLAASGRTSIPVDKDTPNALYRTAGYRICGERAVRVDILERLADLIRPALSWREGAPGPKPDGVFDGRGFLVTGAMTSLTGASGDDFASILRSLGYRMDRKPKPAEPAVSRAGRRLNACCRRRIARAAENEAEASVDSCRFARTERRTGCGAAVALVTARSPSSWHMKLRRRLFPWWQRSALRGRVRWRRNQLPAADAPITPPEKQASRRAGVRRGVASRWSVRAATASASSPAAPQQSQAAAADAVGGAGHQRRPMGVHRLASESAQPSRGPRRPRHDRGERRTGETAGAA